MDTYTLPFVEICMNCGGCRRSKVTFPAEALGEAWFMRLLFKSTNASRFAATLAKCGKCGDLARRHARFLAAVDEVES